MSDRCYICDCRVSVNIGVSLCVLVCHLCDDQFVIPMGLLDQHERHRATTNYTAVLESKIKHLRFGSAKPSTVWIIMPAVLAIEVNDPPTDSELASLRLVSEEKGWKVEYSRLERLINKGWITAMGTTLTRAGKEILGL